MLAFGWLPLLVSLAVASPAPVQPSPLHEIGQDHALPGACGPLVVHANAAIAAQERERQWLDRTIARLRSLDVEGNALNRRGAISDLTRLADELHVNAERGDDELRRLGEAAGRMPEQAHRENLRLFSEALQSAFADERRTADDLAALTLYLEHFEIRGTDLDTPDMAHVAAADPLQRVPTNDPPAAGPLVSPYQTAGSPNRMARAAATDFSGRLLKISAAESRAALHGDDAVTGCS